MDFYIVFFLTSLSLGISLAMDAFSVSLASGLNEPCMKKPRMCLISGIFAFFQFLMPLIGWFCVRFLAQQFAVFEKFIPWIALILLCIVGGKMIVEGIKNKDDDECGKNALGFGALLVQGVATSIDALSAGFAIDQNYSIPMAVICCLLIAAVTFLICFGGIIIGKKAGTKLANKASILGGGILIFIGLEIFITSFFK